MDEKTVVSSVLNELITLVKHTLSLKANASSLAAVATTGSYNDLSNKPTIPTVPVTGVSVNGTALTPQDGVVDVEVPTDYVNTADFEERTGSMNVVLSYSNGVVAIERSGTPLSMLIGLVMENCNVWFVLPTAYITGIPSNTDMMRFWMTGANLDTSAPTVSLTSEYGGKVYHAVLSPVSEYRMEGQLQVLDYQTAQDVQTAIAGIPDELPTVTASDNGKFLRVVSGAWAAEQYAPTTPRVAMTASDTTPTLDPNKLYVFPEMATLAPTLATPTDNTIVNEYHFVFDSGSTATVLTLPTTILQPDGFTVEANMHYEISILEGAMTAQGWAVTA